MYYTYGGDIYYFILLAVTLLSFAASRKVNSTYKKYAKERNLRGITGAEAARIILRQNGQSNVPNQEISGELTDNFDPRTNVLNLSQSVYYGTSPVAVGIACHEVGHALQHAQDYFPGKIRSAIVPVAQIGTKLAFPLILGGLLLSRLSASLYQLVYLGIICFAASTLFHLVTLPTEFNASRRAMQCIENAELLTEEERKSAGKVLTAAAMTYVAALAVSLVQLLRFIAIYGGKRRD